MTIYLCKRDKVMVLTGILALWKGDAMSSQEFESFVTECGKDILNFCRMTAGGDEPGNELYQDTMLKLLEKRDNLDPDNNVKSYALSIAILLWKNRKRKYAIRNRIAPMDSIDSSFASTCCFEEQVIDEIVAKEIRECVSGLTEKYRLVLYLYYSSNMKQEEIAKCLHIPIGTVKSRMNKAKKLIKERLEEFGYE